MTVLDANIELPAGAVPPDALKDGYGTTLPLDHVISRDMEGKPLSYIGDFVWNWTPYDPRGIKTAMYFDYWATKANRKKVEISEITSEREARIREIQHLMVRLIYRDKGRENGGSHLRGRLSGLLLLARFAESCACSLREVLECQDRLDAFIATVSGHECVHIMGWLNILRVLDPVNELGFVLAKPRRLGELMDRKARYLKSSKQHVPLPTRIYSALINALSNELDDIESNKDRLLGAVRAAIAEHAKLRAQIENCDVVIGPAIIAGYDLQDYLSRQGVSSSLNGLSAAVVNIFRVCKLQIHVFSGMRDEEAQHLPFDCMETEKRAHGRKHHLIVGVTTKLEGARRRRTKWVTTESDGFRAIRLAQQFAAEIYKRVGVNPSDTEKSKDKYPLFPSTHYLPWMGPQSKDHSKDGFTPVRANLTSESRALRERLCMIIDEVDLIELEEIDPFRAWRDEPEYAVGQPWPLSTHNCGAPWPCTPTPPG